MKNFLLALSLMLTLSCSNSGIQDNPYLQDVGFTYDINLNLPLYSSLKVPGTAIYIGNDGVGINGIFVINLGTNSSGPFMAYEATDPNHAANCGAMSLDGGLFAICNCDNYKYSLANGQLIEKPDDVELTKVYGMLSYRTSLSGNVLRVYN
ncbi:hypothetical protein ACG2LH_01335 [Zhouia sp. PK063]|uniref:hypothetical protein n=1 Tax=Zhouia sp. PK063 TaxID=3373602 RepID=UPI003799D408